VGIVIFVNEKAADIEGFVAAAGALYNFFLKSGYLRLV
jgi:hypothetical protein